jgi:hypothetical protein
MVQLPSAPSSAPSRPISGWGDFYDACEARDSRVRHATPEDIARLQSKGYKMQDMKAMFGGDCYGYAWVAPADAQGYVAFSDEPHDTELIAWSVALLHEKEQIAIRSLPDAVPATTPAQQ